MLVIRLQRTGRENTPTYRIVVSEKTKSAKKGAHEILGHYLPSQKTPVFKCDKERALYWIGKGAQPSDTVARLLMRDGAPGMEKFVIRYAKKKSKNPEAEAAPPAPAPGAEPSASPEAPVAESSPEPAPDPTPETAPAAEAPKAE